MAGRRLRVLSLVSLAALAVSGCRNPFDPSSDATLEALQWQNFGTQTIYLTQNDVTNATLDFSTWFAMATFVVRNRVGINIESMNVVYTDPSGNPTTGYAATGGRTIHLFIRLDGVRDDNTLSPQTVRDIPVVDAQVWKVFNNAPSGRMVILATVTFKGTDDDGYEQKFVGQISIVGP